MDSSENGASSKKNRNQQYIFPNGLPGFEDKKLYILKPHNEMFSLLSAAEDERISFITINPFDFYPGYEFELPEDAINMLKIQHREQVAVRCIVTWHSDRRRSTVNLLAPLVFNSEALTGKQIVLQHSTYTTKEPLWNEGNGVEQGGGI